VFGSDDYCASIGATRTADGRGLQYARQKVVVTAKAYQLQAIDKVYIDYKDSEGLRKDAQEGACMGFTGKQVIHPGQVEIVQEAFTPSQDHQQWAKELMREFDEHQRSGKGAFVFRDKMIDMPLLRQAQNIVGLCKKMKIPV
jgi:citrate lyase subunit beta-like protein